MNPAEVEAMQCLEEGTQKLEDGDVQAAKVRVFLASVAQLTCVREGSVQTQRGHQAYRERLVQSGRDALPPQCDMFVFPSAACS